MFSILNPILFYLMKERRKKLIKTIKIGYIQPWWKEGGESKYLLRTDP